MAWGGTVTIAGAPGSSPLSSSAIGTPSALARRQTTATVGLAWLRSICESMDFETPAWRESSSSDRPRAWRRLASVWPTRGGSEEGTRDIAVFQRPGLTEGNVVMILHSCSIYRTNEH
jgi:hypothetical protein